MDEWANIEQLNLKKWCFSHLKKINCININNNNVFYKNNLDVQPFSILNGPIIFGNNCRVGPFCFLRGPLIIGDNVKIGPYCEMSRSIIEDDCIISHNNKVLDSYLHKNVHLSGGVITCNKPIGRNYIKLYNGKISKNKHGSVIEINSNVGVNCLLMPGSYVSGNIVGPSIVYGNNKIRSLVA